MAVWIRIQITMGEVKYKHLSTLALQLLSIPTSNADSEGVFSLVRRIKTEYRSSMSTSSFIGCHFNKTWNCCERHKSEESLLTAAKMKETCSMKIIAL